MSVVSLDELTHVDTGVFRRQRWSYGSLSTSGLNACIPNSRGSSGKLHVHWWRDGAGRRDLGLRQVTYSCIANTMSFWTIIGYFASVFVTVHCLSDKTNVRRILGCDIFDGLVQIACRPRTVCRETTPGVTSMRYILFARRMLSCIICMLF